MVQGNRTHGCYYPLSKRQLEWQISINDDAKQAEKEQAKMMQARLSLFIKYQLTSNTCSCVFTYSHFSLNRRLN